jgi:hypothetical protein
MNPKEVSYSHPQLPLCDTPSCCLRAGCRKPFSIHFATAEAIGQQMELQN